MKKVALLILVISFTVGVFAVTVNAISRSDTYLDSFYSTASQIGM